MDRNNIDEVCGYTSRKAEFKLRYRESKHAMQTKTENLLAHDPIKCTYEEILDSHLRQQKILASGSRRSKDAILALRRFRIQQQAKCGHEY